ncbi:MAG: LysR family transcriptional regulator [Solobacterium sp.]|nr:LysR family transcriptional regulator [Solobacterium sp.]
MDFDTIRIFLAVQDTGSISKASQYLYISQSSISRRLSALEEEINTKLLIREKGKSTISLTPAGESFLQIARQMEILYKDVETLSQSPERSYLSIGSVGSPVSFPFSHFNPDFVTRHPEICLSVHLYHTNDIYKRVSNHFIDIGYVSFQNNYPDIICSPFVSFPFVLITRNDSPYRDNMDIEELPADKELYIRYTPQYELWHNHVFPGKNYLVRVSNQELLINYLHIKDSWALCSDFAAKVIQSRMNIPLSVYPVRNGPAPMQYYEIMNTHIRPSRTAAAELYRTEFHEFLKKNGYQF